jgi:hypothetical protein
MATADAGLEPAFTAATTGIFLLFRLASCGYDLHFPFLFYFGTGRSS